MEISLRLILITTTLLITAGIVLAIMTGQVDGFTGALNDSAQKAECELLSAKYQNARDNENTEKYRAINKEAQKKGCDNPPFGSSSGDSSTGETGPGSCGEGEIWCEVAKSCVAEEDAGSRCK